MVASRVCCALALFGFVACSFPDYRIPEGDGGAAASCRNNVRDGDEAGVDCGPSCSPCPLCSDGMLNGNETGIDCGGTCAPCPSCDDRLQNGAESDVDCGGICEKRCDADRRCRESADCASLVCELNRCQLPSCKDEVRNGTETGKDCGGGSCMGCDFGSACSQNSDCSSARCQNAVCVDAACTDGQINGTESDTDCGGTQCSPCATGRKCADPKDCESHVCASGSCSAPSCSDATQNQGESASDCGGSNCSPCAIGSSCFVPSDCDSGLCQNGTCVPKNPLGQPLSRAQWILSSSASSTETGDDQPFDGDVATCWTSVASQSTGMYVDIDLGTPQIFFKVLIQTTQAPYDQDFPDMLEVYVSNDGNFGSPSAPNIMGNQWTWVDFTSAQVGRYVRFRLTKPGTRPWSIGEVNLYN